MVGGEEVNAPFTPAHPNGYRTNMNKPIACVVHVAEGTFEGTVAWFKDKRAKCATHFVVGKNENECVQMVKYADAAIHCGWNKGTWELYRGTSPNFLTIGIENAGKTGEPFTDWQYRCNAWIISEVMKKFKIEPSPLTIVGHCDMDTVNRKNCPGTGVDMAKLIEMVKERMVL